MHEGSASAIPPAIQSISPKSTHHQHQRARQAQRDLIEIQVATHQPTIQQVWQEISVEISMQQSVEISTLEFWVRGLGTHTHTHTHSHARMFERVCWVIFQASFRHSVIPSAIFQAQAASGTSSFCAIEPGHTRQCRPTCQWRATSRLHDLAGLHPKL